MFYSNTINNGKGMGGGGISENDHYTLTFFFKVLNNYFEAQVPQGSILHHIRYTDGMRAILPYSDKRKQLLKMKFLINEKNVSVMHIDINAISLCLDLNIVQQDECFCSKFGMEVKYANSNLKTSLSQIWVICQLLPFVRVGQHKFQIFISRKC